jgi:hypothetical protein
MAHMDARAEGAALFPRGTLTSILQTGNDQAAACASAEDEAGLGNGEDGEAVCAFQDGSRNDLFVSFWLWALVAGFGRVSERSRRVKHSARRRPHAASS